MAPPEIDVHELARLTEKGAVLLDVRNPDEWVAVRVPGVSLIPLPELAGRTDEVPAGEPVYVICASGVRSAKAAEHLRTLGIEAINVAGGTNAWVEAGYATESGAS